jgi:hypothetical protein
MHRDLVGTSRWGNEKCTFNFYLEVFVKRDQLNVGEEI